jgi:cytochrome c oxidase subunit 1
MPGPDFSLAIPVQPEHRRLVVGWLLLALYALIGSGLVVILVVLARTPVMHDLIPWTGSFRTALVIHVDLSVLTWFFAMMGVLATLSMVRPLEGHRLWLGRVAVALAAAGTLVVTFSPFLGVDAPHMNNYVPILENNAFFLGLALFVVGTSLMALNGLRPGPALVQWDAGEPALRFGVQTMLAVFLVAVLVGLHTYVMLPDALAQDISNREYYYEVLWWGSGHTLQFVHTQALMVMWLWLATRRQAAARVAAPRWLRHAAWGLFLVGILPVAATPVIQLVYPVTSPDLREAYAGLMRMGGGLATLPAGLLALYLLWQGRACRDGAGVAHAGPQRVAVLLSILMFGVGGGIGFMIQGINVTIPSHYHGSIVSVTLAYMGLVYHLLPLLGYQRLPAVWATRQLWLYAAGSFLHVCGLAWSGMLGIQRKTAGAEQGLETLDKQLAMGLTGAGGMMAVIAGVLFLVLTLRAIRKADLLSDPV